MKFYTSSIKKNKNKSVKYYIYLTQCVQNSTIATQNHIKNYERGILCFLYHVQNPGYIFYLENIKVALATFQLHSSHIWLVATKLCSKLYSHKKAELCQGALKNI